MEFDYLIANKWKVKTRLGKGAFGEIYKAAEKDTGYEYAVKFEPLSSLHSNMLLSEYKLLKLLQGEKGIPKVYWYGKIMNYNAMVMELLGPNLEDLRIACGGNFSIFTTLKVTLEMLSRLETLHYKNYIHRDVKPENFLISRNFSNETIYMIDYGLAKKYRDEHTKTHIIFRDNKQLTGTIRFASINCHIGIEPTRRDDLEGLCYTMLYLLRGNLPWQGLKGITKHDKSTKIMEMKMSIIPEILSKGYPKEFSQILNYVKSLKFEEKPDYGYIRNFLFEIEDSIIQPFNKIYDWILLNVYKSEKIED